MSDLISRSEVWKAFISRVDSICDLEDVRETLDSIPTIEERKEGEWVYEECQRLIDETDEGQVFATEKKWHCSQCGFSKGFMMYRPKENYCPNCGAKMEGE